MSVIYDKNNICVIDHADYIQKCYENCVVVGPPVKVINGGDEYQETLPSNGNNGSTCLNFQLKPSLFGIHKPYKTLGKPKADKSENNFSADTAYVKKIYDKFMNEQNDFIFNVHKSNFDNNEAIEIAQKGYLQTVENHFTRQNGGNNLDQPIVVDLHDQRFLFPKNCRFFCKDIKSMRDWVPNQEDLFDLIVLDPPWWNKYIRRKKRKAPGEGYSMMYNDDLKNIPLERLVNPGGLVVFWCTNSVANQNQLANLLLAWGLKQITCWYWLKVTTSYQVVCPFDDQTKKQPFELILICQRLDDKPLLVPAQKVILSVPSSIHSHKPPLQDIMAPYIKNGKQLEIFARYLLPNCTSWGLEVCRFQDVRLFENVSVED